MHLALSSNEAPADVVLKLLNASSCAPSAMASTAGKDGMLPLHTAATDAAPLEVIEALLEDYVEGAAERDGNGKVPLHWAAARRAPVEVVEALLKANPRAASQKDNSGWLPLHASLWSRVPAAVVRALLEAEPRRAAEARDADGRLPIHEAVANEASPEMVKRRGSAIVVIVVVAAAAADVVSNLT